MGTKREERREVGRRDAVSTVDTTICPEAKPNLSCRCPEIVENGGQSLPRGDKGMKSRSGIFKLDPGEKVIYKSIREQGGVG
ncbi:hypothetical protein PoB_003816200 [Plakobranchus ocellatus]|uniref:Uncharacterized protein n=1 Tax=Plakobranchus ocellatus TaxID=259542 RepID=A0AAV4AXL6_9GAST|nr:hypothetical protein PoB_003816200 [Plakobranchus ocellatus]